MANIIEKPVFVVGCCNSGTTILWQALRQHRDLDGPTVEGQDLKDLPLCMRHYLGRQTFRMFAHPEFNFIYHYTEQHYDRKTAERIKDIYAEHCAQGKRLIEKSPANSLRTRFLQSIFPDASFVIIVRNGTAVSEGIVRKRWYDPDRQHMAGLKTSIDEAAEQWYNANKILLRDRSKLKRSIVVKYEDLVTHTKDVLTSVLEFCGCDSTDFPIPEYQKDLNDKQIARLSLQDENIINAIAGNMLLYLGYLKHNTTIH